jgi:hypothetical protein
MRNNPSLTLSFLAALSLSMVAQSVRVITGVVSSGTALAFSAKGRVKLAMLSPTQLRSENCDVLWKRRTRMVADCAGNGARKSTAGSKARNTLSS